MSEFIELKTPVGRMIMGNMYEPKTHDPSGRPFLTKDGKPAKKWFFCLALAKGAERHWSETVWGKPIHDFGTLSYPGGHSRNADFAWKIADGDSQVPNSNQNKLCDYEGAKGHWLLFFSSFIAFKLCNRDGSAYLLDPGIINPGDYIQVYAHVRSNSSPNRNPGLYLNPRIVAHAALGEKIIIGVDAGSVGFGDSLPANAKLLTNAPATATSIPPAQLAPSNHGAPPPHYPPALKTPAPPLIVPPPPPPPAANGKTLTEKALGMGTYEDFIAGGWTDKTLIQAGYLEP